MGSWRTLFLLTLLGSVFRTTVSQEVRMTAYIIISEIISQCLTPLDVTVLTCHMIIIITSSVYYLGTVLALYLVTFYVVCQ